MARLSAIRWTNVVRAGAILASLGVAVALAPAVLQRPQPPAPRCRRRAAAPGGASHPAHAEARVATASNPGTARGRATPGEGQGATQAAGGHSRIARNPDRRLRPQRPPRARRRRLRRRLRRRRSRSPRPRSHGPRLRPHRNLRRRNPRRRHGPRRPNSDSNTERTTMIDLAHHAMRLRLVRVGALSLSSPSSPSLWLRNGRAPVSTQRRNATPATVPATTTRDSAAAPATSPAPRDAPTAAAACVDPRASRTLAGRRAGWSFSAPAGTAIVRATVRAWGRADGGLVPEILAGVAGAMRSAGQAAGNPHRVTWTGLAHDVAARLECRRRAHCAPSERPAWR